jgi:diaminopimelate epimerase
VSFVGPLHALKGHGTENDFVIVPDPDGALGARLTPQAVALICDRRRGIGADGLIRIVPTRLVDDVAEQATDAPWCMDYRNADGSIAEMCGNGARVAARYLDDAGLVDGSGFTLATRGGPRTIRRSDDGYAVDLGTADLMPEGRAGSVIVGDRSWQATGVHLPNPHAVVFVADLDEAGPLLDAPRLSVPEAFPDGVNTEFVVSEAPGWISMRVYERGSGETRSCGTGAAAAAVAARQRVLDAGQSAPSRWVVHVPGGRLGVESDDAGRIVLTGPAVIVAEVTIRSELLAGGRL